MSHPVKRRNTLPDLAYQHINVSSPTQYHVIVTHILMHFLILACLRTYNSVTSDVDNLMKPLCLVWLLNSMGSLYTYTRFNYQKYKFTPIILP